MSTLTSAIARFEPISLAEMDSVALMNRIDTKYQTSATNAIEILGQLATDYQMLTINGKRSFTYRTIYFDTDQLLLLTEHLRGKLNREKVRTREYVDSDKRFFELKKKTNKGRTIKSRMLKTGDSAVIHSTEAAFLHANSTLQAHTLRPALEVIFNRITMASTALKERITIDLGLSFSSENQTTEVSSLAIIEVKRDESSSAHTPILETLKNAAVYPESISKYCLGMVLLNKTNRYNTYKPKLLRVNKLTSNGNIWQPAIR